MTKDRAGTTGALCRTSRSSSEPASCVLHYAQMMFEGMKAYRTPDGGIQIFRPDMNIKRMARTNERMCIPELPGDLFLAAVKAVIEADRDWVPLRAGHCDVYPAVHLRR